MLSERSRNFIVGLTVLAALATLMYGIFLLGKLQSFGPIRQYEISLFPPDTNGLNTGAAVEYKGVNIGTVKAAWLDPDPATGLKRAHMLLAINNEVDLPKVAVAWLNRPQIVGSNPSVRIEAPDNLPAGAPMVPHDGSGSIAAKPADNGLIPKAVFDSFENAAVSVQKGADELRTVALDLHMMVQYAPPEAIDPKNPDAPKENASTVIVRLDRTIASLQMLLTDEKLQGNVRQAIANLADASAQLKQLLTDFKDTPAQVNDTLAKISTVVQNANGTATAITGAATQAKAAIQDTQQDIARVSQKLVETLDSLSTATRQITQGKGTTGLLVNDPRLYDSLLDLSTKLKSTVEDLDFLLKKWKDEGVNLKL